MVQVQIKGTKEVWELWLDNAIVGLPVVEDDRGASALLPHQCRQLVRLHLRNVQVSARKRTATITKRTHRCFCVWV